jgi:hypothetical protein
MKDAEPSKPPHLPVADETWGETVEIDGTESWLTTEPDLHLGVDPESKS